MTVNRTYLLLPLAMVLAFAPAGCSEIERWFEGGDKSEKIAREGGYTILLATMKGPDHDAQAKRYKSKTEKDTGWNDLYIVHKSGHSELYWGRYRTIKDARPNLVRAKKYRTPAEVQVYAQAIVVPVQGKDIGPPEWNLRKAQGTYSLLVAVFQDDADRNYVGRKKFAIQYCRRLRENGYEAYYYHSLAKSAVTIGTFGASAVRITSDEDGRRQEQILDPGLRSVKNDFPRLAINGNAQKTRVYNRETKQFEFVPTETYLIKIPTDKEHPGGGSLDSFGHSQPW